MKANAAKPPLTNTRRRIGAPTPKKHWQNPLALLMASLRMRWWILKQTFELPRFGELKNTQKQKANKQQQPTNETNMLPTPDNEPAMNELIPVFNGQINGKSTLMVDARLLHKKLQIKTDFSDWIKKRISEYGFIQGIDFIIPQKKGAQKSNTYGKEKIDYHLTIDVGKEIAMVERNAIGRSIRRQLIQLEEAAREAFFKASKRAGLLEEYKAQFLLDAPAEWVKLFPDDFYEALMKIYGHEFDRKKPTPMYCAQITREQVYNRVVPKELLPNLKTSDNKQHQWFQNKGRELLLRQIESIRAIAKSSYNRADFENRCAAAYDNTGLQVSVFM